MEALALASTDDDGARRRCPGGAAHVWLLVAHRKMLFETPEEDANYNPLPEERPGGFPWGEGQRLGG